MLLHLSNELELPKLNSHSTRDLHAAHFVSLTRDLNTVIFNNTFNRTGVKWKVGFGRLNPDDLARVEADLAMQHRWVETWRAVAPLLADVERILTKQHLKEPMPLSKALGHHLPYDLRRGGAQLG